MRYRLQVYMSSEFLLVVAYRFICHLHFYWFSLTGLFVVCIFLLVLAYRLFAFCIFIGSCLLHRPHAFPSCTVDT